MINTSLFEDDCLGHWWEHCDIEIEQVPADTQFVQHRAFIYSGSEVDAQCNKLATVTRKFLRIIAMVDAKIG